MTKSKEPKAKHVPMRTCIATGKKLAKNEMIRLVRLDDLKAGTVTIMVDPKGKLRGRGANIEMKLDSFDLAVKKKAIDRALKLEQPLSAERIAELRVDFNSAIEERNFRVGNRTVAIKIKRSELEQKLAS
jgi:predicted RNA-binding protein YlxR (DUF448 family)